MKKVVTIGGGTGHFNLLQAIKNFEIDLKAIGVVFVVLVGN